jgi:predicted nucleotidyltransferase component of viral defense system
VIDKQEISDLARELSLDLHVVEKDYVLGWLLAGISANPELAQSWVFKGGTCLKKCYFETYRFSDDKTLARKKRVLKAIFTRFLAAANSISGLC